MSASAVLAATTQRGRFLLEHRDRPGEAVALMRPRVQAADQGTASVFLAVLLRAASRAADRDLVEALIPRIARLDTASLPELLRQVGELRAELAHTDLDGADNVSAGQARHAHENAARRLDEAETRLHHALGRRWVPQVGPDDVRAALGADNTLVEITTMRRPGGPAHYVAITVPPRGDLRFRDLGSVAETDRRIGDLVKLCGAEPDGDAGRACAIKELAASLRLFDDGDELTPGVTIAPAGRWGAVPFGVPPGPGGAPLVDRHLVTIVPSGRWLARGPGQAARPGGPPLVLGHPDFDLDDADRRDFMVPTSVEPLPTSGTEAAAAARLLGAEQVTGRAASRQLLLSARSPRVLHIATHGMFLTAIGSDTERAEPRTSVARSIGGTVVTEPDFAAPAWPEDRRDRYRRRSEWLWRLGPTGPSSRSVLCLAGYNVWQSGGETPAEMGAGMISATEFALLDLSGTDLVVLSACETGVGAVDHADGSLLGLRTAALSAGAACCVSSLWKVHDATTADLMVAFYERLAEGRNAAAALHRAQLAIRESRPDPYFWAGWAAEGLSRAGEPARDIG